MFSKRFEKKAFKAAVKDNDPFKPDKPQKGGK